MFVGGQIGWDAAGVFAAGLAEQVRQTLENIVAVLAEAGAGPEHVVRLTWYVVDREDYLAHRRRSAPPTAPSWGGTFPTMAVVQVVALVEAEALVEIEATAVV